MKRKILFVDDDANILEGMRRMLRPYRDEWDMRFAECGSAALAQLAVEPADVVVTDMRMPKMDGDELLSAVRHLYPNAVRIVLTGQCTRAAMLRLVPLAHRILTKPCQPAELKQAVSLACSLHDLLKSDALTALVGRIGSLPTPPGLYTRIRAELDNPESSLKAIADLVTEDIAFSAKILQVANSALFAARDSVQTPKQAVLRLGAETTVAVITAAGIFARYDPAALAPFSIDSLWDHSRAVSALAGRIVEAEGGKEAAIREAQLAGLFHDIGRLVLAANLPQLYKEVMLRTARSGGTVSANEAAVFGAAHTDVGAYLLQLWGLPSPLVAAVAWHERPDRGPDGSFTATTAVHVAEALLVSDELTPLDLDHLNRLGLGERLPAWQALLETPA